MNVDQIQICEYVLCPCNITFEVSMSFTNSCIIEQSSYIFHFKVTHLCLF